MERERGSRCWYSVLFTLLLMNGLASSQEQSKTCAPSQCGIITNISYPFRLRDDPPNCGDPIYELACENNVTIVDLHDANDLDYDSNNGGYQLIGRYRVLGINYNNHTIRLVDPGIHKGNCSSLPLYSLSQSNFALEYGYYVTSEPYSASYPEGTERGRYIKTRRYILFKQVAYLNCSDPVRDDAAYVDTAPCVNWDSQGGGHVYAVVGDLLVRQFKPQCRLKSVTLIALDWESLVPSGRINSYADVHTVISYGFELSWWPRACANHTCPHDTDCYFNRETASLQCLHGRQIRVTPLGFHIDYGVPKLRIIAEDFINGIATGLKQIVGVNLTYDYHSDFITNQSMIARESGIETGRFVLPTITVRFLLGIIFLSALLIYTCRRRHLSMYENIEDFIRLHNLTPLRYSYKNLRTMTNGFKNKLGEGGFGTVYKGKLRSGYDVAVKMLGKSKANGQEFISEVATIGRIHHANVVHLVGFCVEGTKRALIYEFMPNRSLDKYIFSKEESFSLSYRKIYEISLGIARGVAYLHHGCDMQILHFDIKPHNILLDENFNPKISDFGLVRLYSSDDSIVTLTAARGTIGYMAPELFYKNIGRVSYKADVYSFGMLLMEMTSRRRNLNPHVDHSSQLYFPLWIYDQFDEDKDIEMEDLTEEENNLAKRMLIVALWCIQLKPTDRPSMSKVIETWKQMIFQAWKCLQNLLYILMNKFWWMMDPPPAMQHPLSPYILTVAMVVRVQSDGK